MKKAAVTVSAIAIFLVIGTVMAIYINPSMASQFDFWNNRFESVAGVTDPTKIESPVVKSLSLSGKQKLKKGETETLLVKHTPEHAQVSFIRWSSSDESVATVDDNGVVKAISMGECEISAQSEGTDVKTVFKLSVTDEELEKVNILNNYLIKLPDSFQGHYGKNLTMKLNLSKAKIGNFNGSQNYELLVQIKSDSGFRFSYIVELDKFNKLNEIKNFISYDDVLKRGYESYDENFLIDGNNTILLKTTSVLVDKPKRTKTRTLILKRYSSKGYVSTTTYIDAYQFADSSMQRVKSGEFSIDGKRYQEPKYFDSLSGFLQNYNEIDSKLCSCRENLYTGKFVKLDTAFELDSVYKKRIEWKSDNPSIAKVNENGIVTGVGSGSCVVTGVMGGMDAAVARAIIDVRENMGALSRYLSGIRGRSITGKNGVVMSYKGGITVDIDSDGTKELLLYYKNENGRGIQIDVCKDKNGQVERIPAALFNNGCSGNADIQICVNNANGGTILSENIRPYSGEKSFLLKFYRYKNKKFEQCSGEYKIVGETGSKRLYYQNGNKITSAEFERQTGRYSGYRDFK